MPNFLAHSGNTQAFSKSNGTADNPRTAPISPGLNPSPSEKIVTYILKQSTKIGSTNLSSFSVYPFKFSIFF